MTKYWLLVERYENWLIDKSQGFKKLGFSDRHLANVKKIQKGDKIVIYVTKKSGFAVVYEVVSPTYYRDTSLIWDDIFPLRIEVKPQIVLKEDAFVPVRNVTNELSFLKDKKENWGKCFQNPMRELNEQDYKKIVEFIQRAREA